ncbi:MAG: hypothetical protein AMXMBFR33_28590 [Candidatus Xenobia bacterium]
MLVQPAIPHFSRSVASAANKAASAATEPLDNYELPTRTDMLMRKYSGAATVVGGGLGLGLGVLLDHLGPAATGVLGAAIGVPVGAIGGVVVGGLTDLVFKLARGSKHKMGAITQGGLILGAVAGGVGGYMTGASLGFHPALVLAPAGLQLGVLAHKMMQFQARDRQSPVRDLYKTVKSDPARYPVANARPVLQALRDLEKKGWRIEKTESVLSYIENPAQVGNVSVQGKSSSLASEVPLDKVGRLRNWVLRENLDQLEDPALAEKISGEKFVSDAGLGSIRGYSAPGDKDAFWQLESLKAYDELRAGQGINLWHDGIAFRMDPARGISVDDFLKESKDLTRIYEESLGPAYQADTLYKGQAEGLFNGMLALADAGAFPSVQEAGQAMGRWAEASKKNGGSSWENSEALVSILSRTQDAPALDRLLTKFTLGESRKAVEHLTARAIDPQAKERFLRLATGVGDVERAARLNAIMGGLSGPAYDSFLGVVDHLSSSARAQDLLVDFAMLAAFSNGPEDLARQAATFSRLASAMAERGQVEQAGPTFAALRSQSSSPAELEQKVDAFLKSPTQTPPQQPTAGDPVTVTREELDKILDNWSAVNEASQTLEGMKADEQRTFVRLLGATRDVPTARRGQALLEGVPADLVEKNLAVVDQLVSQRGGQGHPDVLLDYLTLLIGRRPEQSLEQVATDYGALLHGVSQLGKPEEAAPTFAWIRQAQAGGNPATTRELTDKFLQSFLITQDGEKSRHLMLSVESTQTGVQETQQTVVVGGIRINKRRGS